jgi:hypothetical protein
MADYRMVWMRDRISKVLGVQDHPEALEVLVKEHHDEFQAFLDDEISDIGEMEKCILYIYRTFYDRLVEREVVTIEKGGFAVIAVPMSMNVCEISMTNDSSSLSGRRTKEKVHLPACLSCFSSQNYDTTTTS